MMDISEARTAMQNTKIKRTQKLIRTLLWISVPVVLLTIILAWIFYPESYELLYENISNLGNFFSADLNIKNTASQIIMTTGFGVYSLCILVIAILYMIRPVLRYNIIKGLLYFLMTIGAGFIAIPGDHPKLAIIHSIGAILFIFAFGMVNLVSQSLRFIRKHVPKPETNKVDFYLDLVILGISFAIMLFLGIIYVLNRVFNIIGPALTVALWQKILLLVNLAAIFLLDLDDF